MYKVKIKCEGIKPLIMHPKTEEIKEAIRTGKPLDTAKVTDIPPEKEAAQKIIMKDGVIGIPSEYFLGSLRIAGTNPIYRKALNLSAKVAKSWVSSLISVEEEFLPLTDLPEENAWELDKRAVPNPSKPGGTIISCRPKFKKWGFEVTLNVHELLKPSLLKKLVEEAGLFIGVGAARSLGFGRFRPVKWEGLPEELEEESKKRRTKQPE
jgi:hypothetical protein